MTFTVFEKNIKNLSNKKSILIISFSLLAFFSFSQEKKVGLFLSAPIQIDSSNILMIPVQIEDEKDQKSSIKLSPSDANCVNLIFYNLDTDSSHILFENNVLIGIWNMSRRYGDMETLNAVNMKKGISWLFFYVTDQDYNNDKKLDRKDPRYVYATDRNGKNLRLISPENENVVQFYPYIKLGYIILKIQRDSNKDLIFNEKDYYLYKIELESLKGHKVVEIK